MACITFATPLTMVTTQLARVLRYEQVLVNNDPVVERTTLRMSWVVATDSEGNRRLQIQWEPSA